MFSATLLPSFFSSSTRSFSMSSPAANAENNHGMDPEKLYVAETYATPGPIIKRFILPRIWSHRMPTLRGEIRMYLSVAFASIVSLLPYLPVLLPAWPLKVRVGANSPSLWPTMSSVT